MLWEMGTCVVHQFCRIYIAPVMKDLFFGVMAVSNNHGVRYVKWEMDYTCLPSTSDSSEVELSVYFQYLEILTKFMFLYLVTYEFEQ